MHNPDTISSALVSVGKSITMSKVYVEDITGYACNRHLAEAGSSYIVL